MSDSPEPARTGPAAPETAAPESEAPEPEAPDGTAETLALPPTTADREPTAPSPIEEYPVPAGVPVPFAAPPTERDRGRFATRLVLGIVGGAGIVGTVIAALFVSSLVFVNSVYDRLEETALSFMDDVAAERWDEAHDQLCPDLRGNPVETYIDEWEDWGAGGAEVISFHETAVGGEVRIELDDGSTVELDMVLDQSGADLGASVCGWD